MNWTISLLLTAFLFAFSGERGAFAQDWLSALLADVGKINEKVQGDVGKINEQVQREVSNANEKLQNDIRLLNERIQNDVNQVQSNLSNQLLSINEHVRQQVAKAQEEAAKAVKEGRNTPSQSIIVSGNTASSRSFRTLVDTNGKPYQIESEDLVIGKTLIHTERIYNSTSKTVDEQRYTLDLSNPDAKPIYSNATRLPFNA